MKRLNYPKLKQEFPKKRAIITGAASGLGAAIAMELSLDDWTLCLLDQDMEGLLRLKLSLPVTSTSPEFVVVDVSNDEKLRHAIRSFCDLRGGADLLVNSAGVGMGGWAEESHVNDLRQLLDVNVVAVASAAAVVLPYMKAAGRGCVVNVASAAAYHCLPFIGAYSAAKAAVVALTENLVAELSGTGVRAAVVICAFFRSAMDRYTLGSPLAAKRNGALMRMATMTSQEAAQSTLRGIEGKRAHVVFGGQAWLLYLLKRCAPGLWLRLAPKVARKAFATADRLIEHSHAQDRKV